MIVLDTHIWVWWVHEPSKLPRTLSEVVAENETTGLGVSAISLWEIAKLVELKRLDLSCPLEEWFPKALSYPGMVVLALTPEIAIESTKLPGDFHRDPADQLIVATARVHVCSLITVDARIVQYPHVQTPT